MILGGRYSAFKNETDYELPYAMLVCEAGRGAEGLHVGHSELVFNTNVDDLFYGKLTKVIADHDGENEIEHEEDFCGDPSVVRRDILTRPARLWAI
jgi:hypothetical protein